MGQNRILILLIVTIILFGIPAFATASMPFPQNSVSASEKNTATSITPSNRGLIQNTQDKVDRNLQQHAETSTTISTPQESLLPTVAVINANNRNTYSQNSKTETTTVPNFITGIQSLNTLTSNNATPTIALLSPANNSYLQSRNGSQAAINFSIADLNGISQAWYHWDSTGSNTTLSSSPPYIVYLPITEMKHVLYIYANNTLGNGTNGKYIFTTDNTAPIMSFCDPYNISNCNYNPNGTVYNSHMGPTWLTVNINGTPAYNWIFHWDNAVSNTSFYFNSTSGSNNVKAPFGDGPHTLYLYDEDYAGNWGILVGWFITDNTPPTIILKSPTNNTLQNPGTTITLGLNDTNGFASSCPLYSYNCPKYHWDNAVSNTTLDPAYNTTTLPVTPGQHILHVYAMDIVGNWANTTFVFTTASPSPSITLFSPTNNTAHKSGTTISLSITGSYLSTIRYHWDSSVNSVLTGTSPYTLPLIAGDGLHVLYVYANNTAGNATSKTFVFTTDDTPPTLTLISPTNDTTYHSGTTISFTVVDNAGGSGVGTVLYYWDSTVLFSVLNTPYDLFLPVGNGQHILYITANDTVGNSAPLEKYIFITDDSIPGITLSGLVNDTAHHSGTTISLSITSSNGIGIVLYHWDTGVNLTLGSSYNVILPSGDGRHTLYLYVNNTINTWSSAKFVFVTDDTPPTITVTNPANNTIVVLQNTSTPNATVSITDPNGITQILYHWDNDANTTAPTNLASIAFPTQTTGQVVLSIYAEDSAGNWAKTVYVFTLQPPSTSTPSTSTPSTSAPTSVNLSSVISNISTPGFSILALGIPLMLLSLIILFKRHRKT